MWSQAIVSLEAYACFLVVFHGISTGALVRRQKDIVFPTIWILLGFVACPFSSYFADAPEWPVSTWVTGGIVWISGLVIGVMITAPIEDASEDSNWTMHPKTSCLAYLMVLIALAAHQLLLAYIRPRWYFLSNDDSISGNMFRLYLWAGFFLITLYRALQTNVACMKWLAHKKLPQLVNEDLTPN